MNNASTRIDMITDLISKWETIKRFESYKSKELLDKMRAEYYEEMHKLIRYEYETERGE